MSTGAGIVVVAACVAVAMVSALIAWWARGRWQVTLDRDRAAAGAATAEASVDRAEFEEAARQSGLTDAELAEEFDRRFGGGS